MTDEQLKFDNEVRHAYRDVARERTPDALDQAVLQEARRAVRPRYARSRAWTRPVAWAATVALCVAIVLEVAKLPEPPAVPALEQLSKPAEATDSPIPAAEQPEQAGAFEAGRREPAAIEEKKTLPAAGRERQEAGNAPAGQQLPAADMLADEQPATTGPAARVQQDSDSAAFVTGPFRAQDATDGPAFSDLEDPCPPEVLANPDDWAACIRALEGAGLDDAAKEQRRRLLEAFPDFNLP
jgi:hypothetical protein